MTTINAEQVTANHGRDQKESQYMYYIVHRSRKQYQCSAKHEVAMRAFADETSGQKVIQCFAQFLLPSFDFFQQPL